MPYILDAVRTREQTNGESKNREQEKNKKVQVLKS